MKKYSGKIKLASGSFHQKIKYAVGDQLIDFSNVTYYTNDRIGFRTKSKDRSVVALIVEMEHVD